MESPIYASAAALARPFLTELHYEWRHGNMGRTEFVQQADEIMDAALATAYEIEANVELLPTSSSV